MKTNKRENEGRVRGDLTHAPVILPFPTARRGWYAAVKPVVEWIFAVLLLIISTPVILVAALAVKCTSRGPAFYSQTRVGRGGHTFTIYKVRSMAHNCEQKSGPQWAKRRDPRITFVGRILRRTHLDELPQLINVLRGEMSLVGPRPERPEFVPELERHIPRYRDRLQVRPGLTGLAQIQLPPDDDLASVRRKLAYDLYYARHLGLWLDLRLLFCTGLYSLGVPCWISLKLLGIPTGKHVEGSTSATLIETSHHHHLRTEIDLLPLSVKHPAQA